MNEPHPFVPRHGHVDDRRPPTSDELDELRRALREGRERLAAASSITTPKTNPLTDAESAAIARAKLDGRIKR